MYDLAKIYYEESYENIEERYAIDLFIKVYENKNAASVKETEEKANIIKTRRHYKTGQERFYIKKYTEALTEFDNALAIQARDKDDDLIKGIKYFKWKTLLELAWNEGMPLENNFTEACKIAQNELQIKELDKHLTEAGADRVPIELYYCLFYYLKWRFSNNSSKIIAKGNFLTHLTIISDEHTMGNKDATESLNRCKIMAEMIEMQHNTKNNDSSKHT